MPVLTSTRNPSVRAARKLARPGGARAHGRAFLAEGPQAVREGLAVARQVFVTVEAADRHPALLSEARRRGAQVLTVTDEVLAAVTDTVSPQGIAAIVEVDPPALEPVLAAARLVVVCVEVRDPGNAGTIVRTADAAGVDAVVLAGASVDARSAKAVRASAGSIFHLPVVSEPSVTATLDALRRHGFRIVAADARGGIPHHEADLTDRIALLLGNEAHGLDDAVIAASDVVVAIPIHGRAESLNLAAAAAVLTYEAARQRSQELAGT